MVEGYQYGGVYRGKSVFVTGHTGFKGSWLTRWLLHLGARVTGFSLPGSAGDEIYPFVQAGLLDEVNNIEGNVCDGKALSIAIGETAPDYVFHLAAQPIVTEGYRDPVETFDTNVMGTVKLLEALRTSGRSCAVVCVTTDKCYENREWVHAYREEDRLGGYDPYSASKGCAEIVIDSYRRSFFGDGRVKLGSARAGNVIGGGDYAIDRIVPDCIRAWKGGESVSVRNKHSTRPWQHVLEPLSGYLLLGANLGKEDTSSEFQSAFNFGPGISSNRSVLDLVTALADHLRLDWEDISPENAPHEAGRLNLAVDKAYHLLGWKPRWDFEETIKRTALGYQDDVLKEHMLQQIVDYEKFSS